MKSIFTYLSLGALLTITAAGIHAERARLQPIGAKPETKTETRQAVTSVSHIIPQPLKVEPLGSAVNRTEEVLFEDFNNVPDGDFEQTGNIGLRAVTFLASHYYEPGRYVDTDYTPQSGTWEGDWVFAGTNGTVILQCYNPMAGAFLRTPLGDYSGDITVRMRVRGAKAFWGTTDNELGYETTEGSSFNLAARIGGYDSSDTPVTDMNRGQLQSNQIYGDDWKQFEFTFRNEGANSDGYLEISTITAVEIDWIEVTDAATFLAAPVVKEPTNFTDEGFTIN